MKKFLLITLFAFATTISLAQTARVQVIHNCADAIADSVDVYLDGTLLLDNFAFRTATPFIDAPAATPIVLSVAPKNSMSVADAVYNVTVTLDGAKTYILVANGIVSMSGYTPAPAFRLSVFDMGREKADMSGNTDVLVMHGSTDAPTVDVRNNVDNSVLVDDAMFGNFSADYLELPTNDYVLNITDASGANSVAKYSAPLQTLSLDDSALVVVASGFLMPANNSNGPAFGLYVAPAAGGALIPLPVATSVGDVERNSLKFAVWPNPANTVLNIEGDFDSEAKLTVYDITGRILLEEQGFKGKNIDVSTLTDGVYFLKVDNKEESGIQRFTKY